MKLIDKIKGKMAKAKEEKDKDTEIKKLREENDKLKELKKEEDSDANSQMLSSSTKHEGQPKQEVTIEQVINNHELRLQRIEQGINAAINQMVNGGK